MPTLSVSPEAVTTFTAGLFYGFSSTLVGHPFDTLKTRMQALPSSTSSLKVFEDLVRREGVRGLYRGAAPLFLAGGVIRSSQFGVFDLALRYQREDGGERPERILGVVDAQVVVAGFCGGLGRAVAEAPVDLMKTRRQLATSFSFSDLTAGAPLTFLRNSLLFSSFAVYSDLSSFFIEGGLSPFWKGAVCANLAWLTVWPLDVVKSRAMSGRFGRSGAAELLRGAAKDGALLRGLAPGLVRSTLANGVGMVVFARVKEVMERELGGGKGETF